METDIQAQSRLNKYYFSDMFSPLPCGKKELKYLIREHYLKTSRGYYSDLGQSTFAKMFNSISWPSPFIKV
jgi:hypothetical protein